MLKAQNFNLKWHTISAVNLKQKYNSRITSQLWNIQLWLAKICHTICNIQS